jgi:hypothetical protein
MLVVEESGEGYAAGSDMEASAALEFNAMHPSRAPV